MNNNAPTLFVVGIKNLGKDEKVSLLAQLNIISVYVVLLDRIAGYMKKITDVTGSIIIEGRVIPGPISRRFERLKSKIDEKSDLLFKKIQEEAARLSSIDHSELDENISDALVKIADLKDEFNNEQVASAVIHEAASALKIDHRVHHNALSLENEVFKAAIREIIDGLKNKIEDLNSDEEIEFENKIRDQIGKLSDVEKQAIREALDLEELSERTLVHFLRTATGAVIANAILNGFGFGLFLFTTTILKAFSLLIGITIPFAVYTTATSFLGFMLSIPFLLIVIGVTGGLIFKTADRKLNRQIAKILVVVGHANLLKVKDE